MSSNSSDEIKKLNEEYEEDLFQLIMNNAAAEEGKLLWEENERLKNDSEYMPSQEDIKKFTKLLDSHLRKAKHKRSILRFSNMINRAAVAMLAIIIIFSTAMVTIQEFRIHVFNFLINIESKYTSYRLSGSDENEQNKGMLAVNWTNAYVPTYAPEGYELTSVSSSDSLKKIIFTNKKNQALFVIYCNYNSSSSIAVDTENASLVKKIKINGEDGTLSVKDTLVTVAWKIDDHLLTVQGQLSTDEAIKLAENVIFIK